MTNRRAVRLLNPMRDKNGRQEPGKRGTKRVTTACPEAEVDESRRVKKYFVPRASLMFKDLLLEYATVPVVYYYRLQMMQCSVRTALAVSTFCTDPRLPIRGPSYSKLVPGRLYISLVYPPLPVMNGVLFRCLNNPVDPGMSRESPTCILCAGRTVAYQVILEPGIGRFLEFEPR